MANQGDEDEGDSEIELGNEWELACSGKSQRSHQGRSTGNLSGNQNTKRKKHTNRLEESSSDEGNRVMRKKLSEGEFNIILRFRKEDEHIKLSPIALTKELRKKLGEVEMAKTLWDGNLLIIC